MISDESILDAFRRLVHTPELTGADRDELEAMFTRQWEMRAQNYKAFMEELSRRELLESLILKMVRG